MRVTCTVLDPKEGPSLQNVPRMTIHMVGQNHCQKRLGKMSQGERHWKSKLRSRVRFCRCLLVFIMD